MAAKLSLEKDNELHALPEYLLSSNMLLRQGIGDSPILGKLEPSITC